MEEIWKPIVGYEGLYEVSNIGRIKSVAKEVNNRHGSLSPRKEKFITAKHRGSYLSVHLSKNDTKKTISIHRLVATAFIKNIENKPQVNHIDCNKFNNNLSNLEWVTRKENGHHATLNNLTCSGSRNGRNKIKEEDVIFIRKSIEENTRTPRELATTFHVNINYIYQLRDKKSWKHLK